MRLWRLLLMAFLLTLGALVVTTEVVAKVPTVEVLRVKGVVNPVLADYIDRGIKHAEESSAPACVIEVDTPGGLDTSMREIVQDILDSSVPVVVYVYPPGSRAASAGTFITMAAHVAAMSPDTVIGAAHPVSIGTSGETSPVDEKVVNDAAAYIRTLAETRGRNADWAEQAVRQSVSATETEARDMNVVDVISPNIDDLLRQIDGRKVALVGGQEVTLKTAGAAIQYLDMDLAESFLYTIADPNIAYILLGLASIGLLVEISSPGLIFPGVVGGISLVLAFYALGVLPVNWAGVLLILLAFGLFLAEVFAGIGALAAGGVVSLILGSVILFKGGPLFRVNPWLIALVVILVAGFFVFVIQRVVAAHRRQATTGREELVGKAAVVKKALNPEGFVLYKGELWDAISEGGPVEAGEEVTISRVEGLKVYVTRK